MTTPARSASPDATTSPASPGNLRALDVAVTVEHDHLVAVTRGTEVEVKVASRLVQPREAELDIAEGFLAAPATS